MKEYFTEHKMIVDGKNNYLFFMQILLSTYLKKQSHIRFMFLPRISCNRGSSPDLNCDLKGIHVKIFMYFQWTRNSILKFTYKTWTNASGVSVMKSRWETCVVGLLLQFFCFLFF